MDRRVFLGTLAGSLAAAFPAAGQSSSADIQTRFQRSAELQRQALQSLTDPGRAERLISNAHAELQSARSAMVIKASGMKFPDPLLEINTRNAGQALSLLQAAHDALKTNRPGVVAAPDRETSAPAAASPHLEAVRTNLEQALRLTSSVFVY